MGGFCEGVGRMFTPSDSDNQSGQQYNDAYNAGQAAAAAPVVEGKTGSATSLESIETQAAQRRLARLSRYFTSPTGTLDSGSASTGVF